MTIIAVTGTGTGVGKTVVTAAVAALASARGRRVAVVKPVQTGVMPGAPGDVDEISRLAALSDIHELTRLPEPLAPATAARRAGVRLPEIADIAAVIEGLRDRELVLIEGSGGLLVHLDSSGGTLAELALAVDSPLMVVVRAGLGALNETALTCEAARARGLACVGVVVGAWPSEPDLAAICNLEDLPGYAGAPLLGVLPEDASALDPDDFLDVARRSIAAEKVFPITSPEPSGDG